MRSVGKGFSSRTTNLFSSMLVQNPMCEGLTLQTDPQHTPTILQPSSTQPQKTQKPRKPKRKVTQVPQLSVPTKNVANEAVYKELDDRLVRTANTISSLEAERDSGNIDITQSKETHNEAISRGTTLGNTLQSDEYRMKLNELMELCTNLQSKVLELDKTKTTQALEITSLKMRVKKLKKKQRSRTHKLKRLYMERKINDIDADEDITLVNDQDDAEMFDVNDLHGEEVSAAGEVNAASITITVSAAVTITTKEITLAQALVEIKTPKPKAK
nr:hypothetical protein [Tanacetum cinerariifolium]